MGGGSWNGAALNLGPDNILVPVVANRTDVTIGSAALKTGIPTTYYCGDIAELLVYSTMLGGIGRTSLETYLRTKWNL